MQGRLFLIIIGIITGCWGVSGQSYSFDSGSLAPFAVSENGLSQISLTDAPFKDGNASLAWTWSAPASLRVEHSVTFRNFRDGVIFWVYNENPITSPLVCEFKDSQDQTQYYFSFGLNFSGWRICRIGSRYMQGNKTVSSDLTMHIRTPESIESGRIFIDRFSYVSDVSHQNAPDAQLPDNNESANINHWNSLWKWESELAYDIQLPGKLSVEQQASLEKIETALTALMPDRVNISQINSALNLYDASGFEMKNGFRTGAPLVVKPDKTKSDIALAELGTMMYGLALDALFNRNEVSKNKYLELWRYALDQGFAYGSSMGNNHHYAYETRQIFQAAYMMRDILRESDVKEDVVAALAFWSGLPESRSPYNPLREGVVDSWNTLLIPRLIAAMLISDGEERYRAVASLVRWVEGSLVHTPGNMGGLKPDGTVFHHAGHYPAYAVGGFAGLGEFLSVLPETVFSLNHESRYNLAESLLAMTRYTHYKDWTTGMSGRHPHAGAMTSDAVDALGYLALLGGIYDKGEAIDSKLAGQFLRLTGEASSLKSKFSGITPGEFETGFFVYNHAAAGVHRYGNSMVVVKGYNSDVWGSEIYTNDNRYGRYQSYGAVEILNEGSPVSRRASRFNEAGWDWNRLPGATTIHLPLNLLESPITSTLMARSKKDFAGASSLLGKFGVFGMDLLEENLIDNTNYTKDFQARKSLFVFDKRIVCIGTDISNSNTDYATETTLFQQTIDATADRTSVNGAFSYASGFSYDSGVSESVNLLSDLSGNYYRVASPHHVIVEGKEQFSRHNKTKAETKGNFLTARINHGKSPQNGAYEYMIMLKPTPPERNKWNVSPGYRVVRADASAHIVYDSITNVTGYVAFDKVFPEEGILKEIAAETLVLLSQTDEDKFVLSVCDPSLHLPEKTKNSNNTSLPGVVAEKKIVLDGHWTLYKNDQLVQLREVGDQTEITVSCNLGIPVEFGMIRVRNNTSQTHVEMPEIAVVDRQINVKGSTRMVRVFDSAGRLTAADDALSDSKVFQLEANRFYFLTGRTGVEETFFTKKIRL